MNDRLLQAPHIEQPAGYTRVQAIVDPTAFAPPDAICADCDCLVPAGALVFRELHPKRTAQTGMSSKKARRQGFASRVFANFGTPGKRTQALCNEDEPAKFLGVAIDGVSDPRAAHANPDVSGRFTVAMSGTVTVMTTDECLKNCNVGQYVSIMNRTASPHMVHKVPKDFKIRVLDKGKSKIGLEEFAHRFYTLLLLQARAKDDNLTDEVISNWRRVLYDRKYAEEHNVDGYLIGAPQPLPGSYLWGSDIKNVLTGSGTKTPKYSHAPVPPYDSDLWNEDTLEKYIGALNKSKDRTGSRAGVQDETLQADLAYRIAVGVGSVEKPSDCKVGNKLLQAKEKIPADVLTGLKAYMDTDETRTIGTLLEKGTGYARIKLLPMHDVVSH